MTCKHKRTSPHRDIGPRIVVCLGCGEWLPLGPATITPAVEIEIRAAEIANKSWEWWSDCEIDGQLDHADFRWRCLAGCRDYQAGYLAAAILDEEG